MRPTGVVIDTSVWIEFLRGTDAGRSAEVARLVRGGRAVLCGVVEAELLAGVRSDAEREVLADALSGPEYAEVDRSTWRRAGELAAVLRRHGKTVPMSDLILAAVALAGDFAVFSIDNHFRLIPGLRLHRPAASGA